MQPISQLITPSLLGSGGQTDSTSAATTSGLKAAKSKAAAPGLSDRLLSQLWDKMAAMYGSKFTSQFGLTADDTWQRVLAGLTPEQLAHGLSRCRDRKKPDGSIDYWPPGCLELRSMCLDEDLKTNLPPHLRPQPIALPRPPGDPEIARAAIQKMRAMTGRGGQS